MKTFYDKYNAMFPKTLDGNKHPDEGKHYTTSDHKCYHNRTNCIIHKKVFEGTTATPEEYDSLKQDLCEYNMALDHHRFLLEVSKPYWEQQMPEDGIHTEEQIRDGMIHTFNEIQKSKRGLDTMLQAHYNYEKSIQNKMNRQSHQGPWEFTLTYSPRWYDSDEKAQEAMRTAMKKLTQYYKTEIKELHAVGEYTTSGNSHIHCWYHLDSGNKITDKNFKRAYKHWNPRKKLGRGHQGGHHEPIKSTSNFAGYIEKDLQKAWYKLDITNEHKGEINQEDGKEADEEVRDQENLGTSDEENTDGES